MPAPPNSSTWSALGVGLALVVGVSSCGDPEHDAPPPLDAGIHRSQGIFDAAKPLDLPRGPTPCQEIPGVRVLSLRRAYVSPDVGLDLDGLDSAPAGQHCKLRSGAPSDVHIDGADQVDNSAIKNLDGTLIFDSKAFQDFLDQGLKLGSWNLLLAISGLPEGDVPDEPLDALTVRILFGGDFATGASPRYDGTDCWPVVPDGLIDERDVLSSRYVFFPASVKNQRMDTGPPIALSIILPVSLPGSTKAIRVNLPLYNARMEMRVSSNFTSASRGRLGGAFSVESLLAIARFFDGCQQGGATQLAVEHAADMMISGKHDPDVECDAVSFGLGFDMVAAELGSKAPALTTPEGVCD